MRRAGLCCGPDAFPEEEGHSISCRRDGLRQQHDLAIEVRHTDATRGAHQAHTPALRASRAWAQRPAAAVRPGAEGPARAQKTKSLFFHWTEGRMPRVANIPQAQNTF